MTVSTALGGVLRDTRHATGRSLRDVAAQAGIGFPYLSKIERCREQPSEDVVQRLAAALGLDADALLLAHGRMPNDLARIIVAKAPLAGPFLRAWAAGRITDADVTALLERAS